MAGLAAYLMTLAQSHTAHRPKKNIVPPFDYPGRIQGRLNIGEQMKLTYEFVIIKIMPKPITKTNIALS